MVEFALVAPVLVLLLIGLVETGRYAAFAVMAANAARAGVEYGSQNLTTANDTVGMKNAALADAQNLSGWATPTAQHLCSIGGSALQACPTSGTPVTSSTVYYVQVKVTGTFRSLLSYPGLPASVPVAGSAVMRVASQ